MAYLILFYRLWLSNSRIDILAHEIKRAAILHVAVSESRHSFACFHVSQTTFERGFTLIKLATGFCNFSANSSEANAGILHHRACD
ncbi:MAG: hypothetical protein Q8L79_19735 [Methylobacter sp.]|uniref:hypothetical protein n=1 Tax=Methylobacter sp. TaxID=2051955 RepID=UPI002730A4D4|nr:hypothetical protein [Methylobacter sp.]MDP1667344.1 hypothetical protein [Methylobacter sp.]